MGVQDVAQVPGEAGLLVRERAEPGRRQLLEQQQQRTLRQRQLAHERPGPLARQALPFSLSSRSRTCGHANNTTTTTTIAGEELSKWHRNHSFDTAYPPPTSYLPPFSLLIIVIIARPTERLSLRRETCGIGKFSRERAL